MKKTSYNTTPFGIFFIAMIVMIAFSSCSGFMDIEKRHYRKGYYVPKNKTVAKSDVNEIPDATAFSKTEVVESAKPGLIDSVTENVAPNAIATADSIPVQPQPSKKITAAQPEKAEQNKVAKEESSNVSTNGLLSAKHTKLSPTKISDQVKRTVAKHKPDGFFAPFFIILLVVLGFLLLLILLVLLLSV